MCSYQEFMEVMRFNFGIAMDLNNLFIPSMIKREWGRICHVSSISALENQGPPAYGAAKAAINAYVRSLSRYLAEKNVVINGVMPGAIFTEGGYWDDVSRNRPDHLTKYLEERMAIKRLGELSEISELITFLVSEHASFMVGSNVLADGGQGRVFTAIE
jgi:3-oxoacyl-[acyl-carrier protein] reductase